MVKGMTGLGILAVASSGGFLTSDSGLRLEEKRRGKWKMLRRRSPRIRSPSADGTTCRAALAPATPAGGGAVEKIKLRARLIRSSISALELAIKPPLPPSSLLRVPI